MGEVCCCCWAGRRTRGTRFARAQWWAMNRGGLLERELLLLAAAEPYVTQRRAGLSLTRKRQLLSQLDFVNSSARALLSAISTASFDSSRAQITTSFPTSPPSLPVAQRRPAASLP
mgnify:CR=1 FL=1